MDIAVLGTGVVGRTIGSALVRAGHTVHMGSRSADNPAAAEWSAEHADRASHGTFADAAAAGALLFNCTAGAASLDALRAAGEENLSGKVLVDVANPLDFSQGMPPSLTVCNTDSLAERIQRVFPRARVVKALNTMNCQVMVEPSRVPGEHHVFLSGDDEEAKAAVADLLAEAFGWPRSSILDLGGIETARGVEMLLPLWVQLWTRTGTGDFNFHVAGVRTAPAAESVPSPGAEAAAE